MTYPQRCVDECTNGLLSDTQRWADDDEMELSTGFVNNKVQSTGMYLSIHNIQLIFFVPKFFFLIEHAKHSSLYGWKFCCSCHPRCPLKC